MAMRPAMPATQREGVGVFGFKPRISNDIKPLLGWLRNVLGLFGLGSFVQDTLFLRDALAASKVALGLVMPYVDQVASIVASILASYRALAEWVLDLVGLGIPLIFVDVILALSLSHLLSRLIFSRSRKRIEQQMQSAFGTAAARQGLGLFKVKQDFAEMSRWERMRTAWQVMPGVMGGVVKAQYSLLVDPFILSLARWLDQLVSAILIAGTLILLFNIDTYYRLYMV